MATLVLSTVGAALGGPIGGALGSLIGQSLDQGLFGPGMRKGPRLGDLAIQTSSYGSPIPRIYGTMRVAGTVVWATDLIEEESIDGGGKSSPERLAYSYSANLAVALSSRPVRAVRRIWADGKLIRGAAGDFKVRTGFRLHRGDEDQAIDPLIGSVEGIVETPAYRGLALAVFERLELAEFGNRIPVLTFEVEADEGPVALADLLLDASGGSIAAGSERRIAGFAAHGSSIGDAVRTLIELSGCQLTDRDMALRTPPADPPVQIAELELGCDPEGERQPVVEQFRTAAAALPASLTMTYYNARSDYQAGQVRASAGSGARGDAVELPAVLDDGEARQLAEEALAARWRRAERIRLNLPPARIGMAPGTALQLPGSGRVWIATKVEIAGMAVLVEAEAAPVTVAPLPSDGGRPVREPDVPVGRTVLTLFELPDIDGGPSATVKLAIAGSTAGQWKPVPVAVEVGGAGQAGIVLGRQAVCGRAMSALGAAPANLVDEQSCVLVRLENGAQTLLNADFDALAGGANLAILGEELIQFARAERIEPGLFRLFTLLRGQRGTEWATAGHAIGERFCLLDARFLGQVELPLSALGAEVRCTAHGIGDAAPLPTAARTVAGESLRPLSPCHLTVGRSGNGLILTWVRRSRSSWAWIDGVGDGADDISELYRVTAAGPLGAITFETAERLAMLDPGQIPAAQGQEVSLSVAAIGSATMSHAATAHIIL